MEGRSEREIVTSMILLSTKKKLFCRSDRGQESFFFQASVIVALINSSKSGQVYTMAYALDSCLFARRDITFAGSQLPYCHSVFLRYL